MLIGAHVSPAGGLPKAIERGLERDCRAIQIFNQSPRMWRPTVYREEDVAAFREAMADQSDRRGLDPRGVPAQLRQRGPRDSREVARVADPFAARGPSDRRLAAWCCTRARPRRGDPAKAVARAGETIREALAESEGCPLHLENTAGAGGTLGRSIDELASLLEASGASERLGLCLDSCHLFASGYDIRTYAGHGRADGRDRSRRSAWSASARCTSTTHRLRSGPTATVMRTSARASWVRAVARRFCRRPRFQDLPCVLETPGENRSGPTLEEIQLAVKLRERGLRARKKKR